MFAPPLDSDSVQFSVVDPPGSTTIVNDPGGDGGPNGVTVCAADDAPVPTELTADTLNQYGVPLVRPVMVMLVDVVPVFTKSCWSHPVVALVVDCSIV